MAHDQLFLLPVVVDDTPDAAARVPERFRERQWTRLRDGTVPPEFPERVRNLISGAPVAMQRDAAASHATRPATHAPAKEKSVAVLPFANLSGDKDNEYFSDGVSEELLTVLQKIPGLRVAARTSAFSFKGKVATAQEIGSKLGVAHLVEGSVQKSGNRVKVTARLSLVSTGDEQWSRSYTRQVEDVFALQEELALAIVGELRGHFGGDMAAASQVRAATKGGTMKAQAYEEYLMGRHFVGDFSEASETKALAHFLRATELDPNFASAWASLSQSYSWFCGYSGTMNRETFDRYLANARAAAERALALEPDLAAALAAKFWIQSGYDFDIKGCMATVDRALQVAPSDPTVSLMACRIAIVRGQNETALELARRSVALDPISAKCRVQLLLTLLHLRKFDEARQEAMRVAELNPNSMFAKSGLAYVYLAEGRYAEAEASVQNAGDEWHVTFSLAIAQFALGKRSEADAALQKLVAAHSDTAAVQIASVYAFRGEVDECFPWLERSRDQRDPGLLSLGVTPFFNNVRSDPRWTAFWAKMGFEPKITMQ
jgi:TolB-like protein/Flp pilus assembly protein TadD